MLEVTEVHLHLEVTSGMRCANAVVSGCNKQLPTGQEKACICKIKQSCLNHEQRCFKRQWLVLPVQTLRSDISVAASEEACVSQQAAAAVTRVVPAASGVMGAGRVKCGQILHPA